MDPDIKSEEHLYDDGRPASSVLDTSAAEAALKAKLSRKRTKTGCLTCRKRRIKCGEERPVCKNCIKSKRHCEGYNQRVIFKRPTFDYRPVQNGGAHITFQAGLVTVPPTQHYEMPAQGFDPSAYAQLRPRPTDHQYVTVYDPQRHQYVTIEQPRQQQAQEIIQTSLSEQMQLPHFNQLPEQHYQVPLQAQYISQMQQYPKATYENAPTIPSPPECYSQTIQPVPTSNGHAHQTTMSLREPDTPPVTLSAEYVAQTHEQKLHQAAHHLSYSGSDLTVQFDPAWPDVKPMTAPDHDLVAPASVSSKSSKTLGFSQSPAVFSQQAWTSNTYVPRPELTQPIDYQPQMASTQSQQYYPPTTMPRISEAFDYTTPEFYDQEAHAPPTMTPTYMLNIAAVEQQDDDYYDVESDEEMDIDTSTIEKQDYRKQRTLSKVLALNHISVRDLHSRRYDTFIFDGILDQYRVEEVASPLKNPATARVFAHFISATGPSLSIFERHPRNTSVLFTEGSIPFSQQGLWTYTMPMAALHHQGLLHAMLALASLHIARLQNASVTPSMQHYAWALKRIHNSVSKPNGRLKLTTIAASMLLGFYEIMTADHMKWNMHLAGSRQLFVETDFAKMTQEFRRLKLEKAASSQLGRRRRNSSEEPFSQGDLLDQIPDVDERVISHFVGREVDYDNHGCIETPHIDIPPALDLNKFEILKDLYWWYCKQDVYQSLVGGNPLLMEYSRWANCPPRAPLGRADMVCGTFDHLVLLLGRIADFAARDRERKLKQMDSNGGHWKPAPGMRFPQAQQHAPAPPTPVSATNNYPQSGPVYPPSSAPQSEQPAMPMFFGMAPPPRANVQMPSSYTPTYTMPTPQSAHAPPPFDFDLQAALTSALEEYGRIRAALRTFATNLGDAFEPLSSEYQTPLETAFGTALFYRSYDIGCLWAVYNMAEIIAIRSHPHMPPAAHAAAAVAAHETAHYANEIGRIAAGIVPGPADQPLNPALGAALCESCMPSFFAAVQYHDARQRFDTVTRIFSIAKRTGWGSAELIANGCETAWVKAAATGRGPPYQRIMRPHEYSEDPRLNGSWERLDPNALPDENNEADRRLVKMKATARLNWAIGVMGLEEDVEKFRISD